MGTRFYISLFLFASLAWSIVLSASITEPEYYASLERINITYWRPEYGYVNATALRPGRWDYRHYVNAYLLLLKTLDNKVKVDFYFYEFRSNEYRRGFVEMHFRFCDLILKDFFFGPALRANLPGCPLPPGEYRLYNMSIPDLPLLRTFPFRKGRIYGTYSLDTLTIGNAYTDIEIKPKPKPAPRKRN